MTPLFSRGGAPAVDLRPRDYVLTGTSLVTADDRVVRADLVVRFEPTERPGEANLLGWDPDDEPAVHAVALAVLRATAETLDRDALVAERAGLAGPVQKALAFAPVPTGFHPTVTSLEVGDHVASSAGEHRFDVLG